MTGSRANRSDIDRTRRAIRPYQILSVRVRRMTCSLQIDSARHQPPGMVRAPGWDAAVEAVRQDALEKQMNSATSSVSRPLIR